MNIPHDVHLPSEVIRMIDHMETLGESEYRIYLRILELLDESAQEIEQNAKVKINRLKYMHSRIKTLYPDQP